MWKHLNNIFIHFKYTTIKKEQIRIGIESFVLCTLTIFSSVAPIEPIFIDFVSGCVAGSMEELPLVVWVSVLALHFLLHDLEGLPHAWVLDPVNLR